MKVKLKWNPIKKVNISFFCINGLATKQKNGGVIMKELDIRKNETGHLRAKRKGHHVVGVAIFWLAKNAGWIPVAVGSASIFWPVALMATGTFMLIVKKNHHRKKEV